MDSEHFEALYPDATRFQEITQIVAFIKKGESCQLIGIPGVSRSTLLELLTYNASLRLKHLGEQQNKFHFVLANFSEIRKRSLFDAMKFLFLSLAASLRERGLSKEYELVNGFFREALVFHDELVLFQGLKQAVDYLALERKMTLVFLFDRFEEYVPSVTSEFFSNLRILRNRAKFQFSIVFSLNRPLEMVLEPALLADYYEFVAGHVVAVSLYDKIATDFRIASIEKVTGRKISEKLCRQIVSLTGGHSKLTKLAVEAVLAHEDRENDLPQFLLTQKSIRGALMEIWLSLSPAEQADLLSNTFHDPTITEYLETVGLLLAEHVQIPLFQTFVQAALITPQNGATKIIYDQYTNTIRKGEIVLSDQLTASEFRLLRYFLQNQEHVVERDELISIVWPTVKSTAGITDQAIDQLIFRLRRKIEENPNNPVHLQTVKGRGFRFTA